jgi:hypothetical protein
LWGPQGRSWQNACLACLGLLAPRKRVASISYKLLWYPIDLITNQGMARASMEQHARGRLREKCPPYSV